jgi:hypothetical protein
VFFWLSGVIEHNEAIRHIKQAIGHSYGKKGQKVVEMNEAAVDSALAHLQEVTVPLQADAECEVVQTVPVNAPKFVREVTAEMMAGRGDMLPVSAFPVDGTWPLGTAVGKAQSPMKSRGKRLCPVQQMRAGLSARGDPRQGIPGGGARPCACDL